MYTKYLQVVGRVVALMMFVTGAGSARVKATDGIPKLTIEATAAGFTVPKEMPKGAVQVTFANHSEKAFGPVVVRLKKGATLEDLEKAINAGVQDPALSPGSLLGGVTVMPGKSVDVTFAFAPGNYVVGNPASGNPAAFQPFTVVDSAGEGAAPPKAEVEIGLVDFAFNMPIALAAGPQLWHIRNLGDQLHEIIVAPLDEHMTAGEFNQALLKSMAGEPSQGQTVVPVIFWMMSPGEQAWITYDLKPGTYAVVCALADTSGSGHTHADLGMRQIIIVKQ